jgi:phage/plasmid-like protein (TIGR03299 family)
MPAYFDNGLFFGQNAWHGLGTTLPADSPVRFSVDESIVAAGLDWRSETADVAVNGSVVPGHKAIVRSDSKEVLGIVGNRYTPLQNREQFEWFQPFLDSGECAFETCGSLKGGQLVWVLAKIQRPDIQLGETHDAAGDAMADTIRKYLLLTTSHDGSKATSVGFCPIRVVCWNTLSAALSSSASQLLKVKHTKSQKTALATIRDTINTIDQTFEATAAQYRKLVACNVNRDDLRKYVKMVLELADDEKEYSTRQKNILDGVVELCVNGVGNDGKTAWSAYNGVTHYVTHSYGRNADSRLRANWYGEGKRIADRAFALALQLAG